MATNFNIVHWNCNSVRARQTELPLLIHDINVLCLQETKLKTDTPYTITGFNIIRKERENNHGRGGSLNRCTLRSFVFIP